MRSLLVVFVIAIAVALAGCGSDKEAQMVGTWKPEMNAEMKSNPMAGQLKQMFDQLSLTLTKDKRFTMQLPFSQQMEGTWSLSGDKLSITADKVNGKSVADAKKEMESNPMQKAGAAQLDKPSEFTISADMKSLTPVAAPGQPANTQMVFKKAS